MMNLIANDISRCGNASCPKKTICKRSLQIEVDLIKKQEDLVFYASFDHKDCKMLIRKD